jgi:3-keto-disaccharide hydrolase
MRPECFGRHLMLFICGQSFHAGSGTNYDAMRKIPTLRTGLPCLSGLRQAIGSSLSFCILFLIGCAPVEKPAATSSAAATPAEAGSSRAAATASAKDAAAAAVTKAETEKAWPHFDEKSLAGWKEADYAGKGTVKVEDGKIILGTGYMTGIAWTNAVPRMNYEISLQAMRVEGSDFFCGLTFSVDTNFCSFVVGGWGGGVVGLSSIDGEDAANNNTTRYMNFENGRWYSIRVRISPTNIDAWIDDEQMVDQETTDHRISIRIEMDACKPFGIATWSTTGALRNLRVRPL